MALNLKKVIEAKFRRDAKNVKKTFLYDDLLISRKDVAMFLAREITLLPHESIIVVFYDGPKNWFAITEYRIINQIGTERQFISFKEVEKILAFTNPKTFLEEKLEGLQHIDLLKGGEIYRIRVEKESFSLICGIIQFLL